MIVRLCLVAVLLAGCESATIASAVPSAPAGGTASAAASAASPAGSPIASTDAGEPTPDIPVGMPVYPGASPDVVPADLPWASAAWSVQADPPDVYAYFLEQLPAAGYTIDIAAPGGGAAVIRFSTARGDRYQLDLTGGDSVRITLGSIHD